MKTTLPGIIKIEWMYTNDFSIFPAQILESNSKISLYGLENLRNISLIDTASMEEESTASITGEQYSVKVTFRSEQLLPSSGNFFQVFVLTTAYGDRFLLGDKNSPFVVVKRISPNEMGKGVALNYELTYSNVHGIVQIV